MARFCVLILASITFASGSDVPTLPDRALVPSLAQYVRKSWQTDDGLPQDSVSAVVQTADGYLWLGTEVGLARFDGVQFEVFDKNNTPQLATGKISSLLVDDHQTLWIGTHGGGLTCYRNGQFQRFGWKDRLGSETVLALHQDRSGAIWIGTEGSGLFRATAGHLKHFGLNEGLPANSVFSISEDRRKGIWVGTQSGLAYLPQDAQRLETVPLRSELEAVRSVFVDSRDTLWVGTRNGLVNRAAAGSGSFSVITELAGNTVVSLMEDRAHSLWIGTLDAGLQHWSGGRIIDALRATGVWSLLQDRSGTLWVGTTNSGVVSLRPGAFTPIGSAEGLVGDVSLAVYQDHSDTMWIGSDKGLTHWQAGEPTRFTTHDGLPANLVFSVAQDGAGTIWAGTGKGLAWLDRSRFRAFTPPKGVPIQNAVMTTFIDDDGSLWIGYRGGISHLLKSQIAVYNSAQGLADRIVNSLKRDKRHHLWAGTDGGGLFLINESGQQARNFRTEDGLSSNIVYGLLADDDGSLWISTSNGLSHFADGTFHNLTRTAGLLDDEVFQTVDDHLGNLWLTSNRGIQRISKADLSGYFASHARTVVSQNFGVSDGMRSRECNGGFQPAGWRASNGRLWFPTMRGAVSIDPRIALQPVTKFAPLIDATEVESKAVPLTGSLSIPPGRRQVEFHFTAPGVASPEKLRFFYQLEGFDRDWVNAGSRRIGYYTNLPPGNFHFRVRACLYKTCEENGAGLPVLVKPAFYETVWFGLGITLFVAATAFGLHQVRVWQLRQNERKLLAIVDERTQELRQSRDQLDAKVKERTEELSEANRFLATEVEVRKAAEAKANAASRAKSEFLSNMSHEIRTPINGIMGMTELALLAEPNEEQTEYLEIIQTSSATLLRIVNDILDFSKIEARKLTFEKLPFFLSDVLGQLDRLLVLRAAAKGLSFTCTVAPEIPDDLVGDAGRLRQTLLNLLENALKFTEQGAISLRAVLVSSTSDICVIEFSVTDTGIGIAPQQQALIFEAFSQADYSSTRKFGGTGLGLAICKQLVELMNGTIHVESVEGVGSTFRFTAQFTRTAQGANDRELVLVA